MLRIMGCTRAAGSVESLITRGVAASALLLRGAWQLADLPKALRVGADDQHARVVVAHDHDARDERCAPSPAEEHLRTRSASRLGRASAPTGISLASGSLVELGDVELLDDQPRSARSLAGSRRRSGSWTRARR
jgi:hypothetical protein